MVPAGNPSLFLQSIKFDLLRKYHFLTLSACGLRGDESHLLPRWAGHSKLANQHISFPWGWFQVEHMIKPGQWDSLWVFFWNLWEKGIGFLLGWPVCCLVATLPSVDITSSGESQHREDGRIMRCRTQITNCIIWTTGSSWDYPHILSIDNFFVCFKLKLIWIMYLALGMRRFPTNTQHKHELWNLHLFYAAN